MSKQDQFVRIQQMFRWGGPVALFIAEQTGLFSSGFVDHPVPTGICPFDYFLLKSGHISYFTL